MTTQHTHSESNDVDTNDVNYPHAPTTDAAEAPFVPAAEAAAQANGNSAEHSPLGTPIPAEVAPAAETAPAPAKTETEAPPSQETPAADLTDEQSVRPFTEFIEEFRQSEARFQAALQTYEVETPAVPVSEGALPESEVTRDASAALVAQGDEMLAPKEAAVSPLLRPSSRLRMPRHGSGRVREVAPLAPVGADSSRPSAPVETPSAAPNGEPETTGAPAEETQRPQRRYRFDRPAPAASVPAAATVTPAPRVESLPTAEVEVTPSPAPKAVTPPARPGRFNRHAEPAAASQPEAPAAPAPVESEHRKGNGLSLPSVSEQPSATEAALPTAEPAAPAAEINPEDLPPLEYAELQKANSRRRRRSKHNGTAPVAAAAPTPAIVPAPAPASQPVSKTPPAAAVSPVQPASAPPIAPPSPVAVPRPIATPPVVAPSQYSIHSGYTMNQMNQGDGVGPFMPPEPSPARGSTLSSSTRVPRIDRTGPAGRSAEGSHITISNLTGAITQAFQTQTDRMIAELRRANQTPTNITVSMPTMPSTERVGVFVDVANLLYSARTLRITVDFGKLLDFLRGNRRLVRAQAYCPTSPQPGDEQMFLQAVKGLGYRITTKNYKTFASGAKKADLDLDLCMDVVRLVDGRAVDSIVLVSGDSDFMPMLDYCSDHGVRVEVAAFDEAMSATLRQSCDLFVNLAMLEEIRA